MARSKFLNIIAFTLSLLSIFTGVAFAQSPQRAVTTFGGFNLSIGLITDDIWVFELSPNEADPNHPFELSMMITPGTKMTLPQGEGNNWSSSTVELRLVQDPPSLTLVRQNGQTAFTISPYAPDGQLAGISFIDDFSHIFGLGADFRIAGTDLNLIGEAILPGDPFGNSRLTRMSSRPNQVQIPIIYGLGKGKHCGALFVDETLPLMWSFNGRPWTAQVAGPLGPERAFRFIVITGEDMPSLRRQFMTLTGTPPVPPLKAFGVWATNLTGSSEKDWLEKLAKLKSSVPGFVGMTVGLTDDYEQLSQMAKDNGLNLMMDESAYVPQSSPLYPEMARRSYLVRQNSATGPIMVVNHFGERSGLVDYTNPALSTFWHSLFRTKQINDGVTSFRLVDGDLENFSPSAWYEGPRANSVHSHYAWSNSFPLKWVDSIMEGFRNQRLRTRPRLLVLSRTAIAGLPRLAGMLYNGDSFLFGARSLLAIRAHLALSGTDYYSSDITQSLKSRPLDINSEQLYDAWLAKSALVDIPLILPEEILSRPSARYNLALRESLSPYLYSLGWEAYLFGNPVVAPLPHYFQEDGEARNRFGELMMGQGLLLGLDIDGNSERVNVYVPQGLWYDWRTGEVVNQAKSGLVLRDAKYGGHLTPPLLAKSGAIIPSIEEMINKAGQSEKILALKIFIGTEDSQFVWYEDDGETLNYQGAPTSHGETMVTAVTKPDGSTVVTVKARQGGWEGAPAERQLLFDIYGPKAPGEATLDNMPHNRVARASELGALESGWASFGNNRIRFKTPMLDVNEDHVLWFK